MKTPEDEAFDDIARAQGWRKRQIMETTPMTLHEFYDKLRNDVLEEVACEFDNMKGLGDTAASFAVFVRSMKK
jgi:hypothetical protein